VCGGSAAEWAANTATPGIVSSDVPSRPIVILPAEETDKDRQGQTETYRDRQRQTETNGDRERQRQTETDRQTDTDTDTYTVQQPRDA